MIKIKAVHVFDTSVCLQIIEQTNRMEDFNPGISSYFGNTFYASNGYQMISRSEPQVSVSTLFVRGSIIEEDNKVLLMSEQEFSKLVIAVQEYNKMYMESVMKKETLENSYFIIK